MAKGSQSTGQRQRALAKKHGVVLRTVREWKRDGDPRWLESVKQDAPAKKRKPTKPTAASPMSRQIQLLAEECDHLASRASESTDLSEENTLRDMLNKARNALRQFEKDNPDISKESGDLVPKTLVIRYVGSIISLLDPLPSRILSIIGLRPDDELGPRIEAEINAARHAATEIPFEA